MIEIMLLVLFKGLLIWLAFGVFIWLPYRFLKWLAMISHKPELPDPAYHPDIYYKEFEEKAPASPCKEKGSPYINLVGGDATPDNPGPRP